MIFRFSLLLIISLTIFSVTITFAAGAATTGGQNSQLGQNSQHDQNRQEKAHNGEYEEPGLYKKYVRKVLASTFNRNPPQDNGLSAIEKFRSYSHKVNSCTRGTDPSGKQLTCEGFKGPFCSVGFIRQTKCTAYFRESGLIADAKRGEVKAEGCQDGTVIIGEEIHHIKYYKCESKNQIALLSHTRSGVFSYSTAGDHKLKPENWICTGIWGRLW